jgi:hypothetical protein
MSKCGVSMTGRECQDGLYFFVGRGYIDEEFIY